MKRLISILIAVLLFTSASVLAAVPATPNQKLAFRTGPNTKYVELYTLPQSTSIQAIEYESGNGVTWVLVEYNYNGERCRAYTGLKRMSVRGNIPWASHQNQQCRVNSSGTVFAAPAPQGAYRGYLNSGDQVTLLRYDGSYAFIEFYDGGTPSRGYIPAQMLQTNSAPASRYPDEFTRNWKKEYKGDCYVVNCNEWVSLREHADESSSRLIKVPLGARVTNVYNTSFNFYYCEYNGYTGFIKKQYLSGRPQQPANNGSGDKYNLNNYGYRPVVTKGRGALVFQKSPRGAFLSEFKFWDGDQVYVNLNYRQDGYALAYKNGVYGYVDASYIDWGSSNKGGNPSSNSSAGNNAKNLSFYQYRTVDTRGRGALVFQSSPRGSFMSDYKFYDGDRIYVNVNWRKDGYAMAYQNGVYGYVDASYISW